MFFCLIKRGCLSWDKSQLLSITMCSIFNLPEDPCKPQTPKRTQNNFIVLFWTVTTYKVLLKWNKRDLTLTFEGFSSYVGVPKSISASCSTVASSPTPSQLGGSHWVCLRHTVNFISLYTHVNHEYAHKSKLSIHWITGNPSAD